MGAEICIWPEVEEKLWLKHRVSVYEVEEALADPRIRTRRTKGKTALPVYEAVARTEAGRYLFLVVRIRPECVEIITAYDAEPKHRRFYNG